MDELIRVLSAWRIMRVGTREVIDGLVVPEHRGPSPALRRVLDAWPGGWYWADREATRLVLVRALPGTRAPRWWLHLLLFVLTVISALGAGAALAGVWYPYVPPGFTGALTSAGEFFAGVVQGEWRQLLDGWTFAVPLVAILLIHELGHYFAARRYEIDTTPPYFLPVPPTLSPIGSLGAFLRLRSPVLDRRQLLDVGAAGPLAGFVVTLLVLAWGYPVSERMEPGLEPVRTFVILAGGPVPLGDSLLTILFREAFHPGVASLQLSLPAFAGWVGA